ncbi:MAG: DNA polymerase III subunit beta [Peptococcaceae bacterium]|nr:DNA polymerase III subunit beta [Peptococcaceae bacterium]
MKITIARDALENAVYAAFRATNPKSPLVSLTGVLLSARGDSLTATGTDLEVTVSSTVHAEVIDEGDVLLPGRHLYELVKRLPIGPVVLEASGNEAVLLYGKQCSKMSVFPLKDYPKMPAVEGEVFTVDPSDLAEAIEKVLCACSGDIGTNLSGVYFDVNPFGMEVVATDKSRLHRAGVSGDGTEASAIVPYRAAVEIKNALRGKKTQAVITFGSLIGVQCSGINIVSRLIPGKYVPYETITRQEKVISKVQVLNAKEMVDALERALLYTTEGKVSSVTLEVADGTMHVKSNGSVGSLHEQLKVVQEGGRVKLTFVTQYLLDALKGCEGNPYLYFSDDPLSVKVEDGGYSSILAAIRQISETAENAA